MSNVVFGLDGIFDPLGSGKQQLTGFWNHFKSEFPKMKEWTMNNDMNQIKKVVTAMTAHSNSMDRSYFFIFGMCQLPTAEPCVKPRSSGKRKNMNTRRSLLLKFV